MLENLEIIVDENLGFQLFEKIERCKVQVNQHEFAEMFYEYADLSISEVLKISEFEQFSKVYTDKIFKELNACIKLAGLNDADIDYIHCTGGTSKLKVVQRLLKEKFSVDKVQTGNEFSSVLSGLNEYALTL